MSLMRAPASGVTVRMYRQGFGDCFVLAFKDDAGGTRHVLIDCGVHQATDDRTTILRDLAAKVHEATGGTVEALIATHEHYDHLAGFNIARPTFDTLEAKQVWLAWTEDPDHPVAQRLRARKARKLNGIRAAVQRLRGVNAAVAGRIEQVLGFSAEDLGAAPGTRTLRDAIAWLATKAAAGPRYCRPGEVLALPGLSGVRFYVLGPPEDERLLLRSEPSKTEGEVYELAAVITGETAFLAAAEHGDISDETLDEDERRILELSYPFEPRHRLSRADAEAMPHFQEYLAEANAWRSIDDAWLGSTEQLALDLDSDTNNTSLVIAVELVRSGRVLLFAADAQVGNWLSWQDVALKDAGDAPLTADQLLARTVLYKVGHHGSHNATLRDQGLERMTSADLVAMIPTDEAFAREPERDWNIPFPPLLSRLREKCRGRILRADRGRPRKPAAVSDAQWQLFRDRITGTADYYEYEVLD
jgi:hypothetical protein